MRQGDPRDIDYRSLRSSPISLDAQILVEAGHIMVPAGSVALGAVITNSLVVTLFSPQKRRGGLCHFLYPRPAPGQAATPIFGLPAVVGLLRELTTGTGPASSLKAGLYGAACPPWASQQQRADTQGNVTMARRVLEKKGVAITDQDVGGDRGRKIWYLTGTNEIAVLKTDAIRRSDWFTQAPRRAR